MHTHLVDPVRVENFTVSTFAGNTLFSGSTVGSLEFELVNSLGYVYIIAFGFSICDESVQPRVISQISNF